MWVENECDEIVNNRKFFDLGYYSKVNKYGLMILDGLYDEYHNK